MTTAQVVETSVTVNNNSPIQDYVLPDDQTQPTFELFYYLFKIFQKFSQIQKFSQRYLLVDFPRTLACLSPRLQGIFFADTP